MMHVDGVFVKRNGGATPLAKRNRRREGATLTHDGLEAGGNGLRLGDSLRGRGRLQFVD